MAREPASAQIRTFALESSILNAKESRENPANTMLWIAPILAQASAQMAASGTMGR